MAFVAFGRPWGDDAARHNWVDVDGSTGTRQAAEQLRRLGHTRIGFIGWAGPLGLGPERRSGWLQGMAGIEGAQGWSIKAVEGLRAGAQAAAALMARGVTAIVCASDSLALGAADAFRQAFSGGPAVPVVGFDDTPVAAAVGLSSVAQPVEQAAAETLAILLGLLHGRRTSPRQLLLPSTLVLRGLAPREP